MSSFCFKHYISPIIKSYNRSQIFVFYGIADLTKNFLKKLKKDLILYKL